MTSKEAMRHTCKPGYWLENIAPLGELPDWQERVAPIPESGLLFGYEERAFLAKQYKPAKAA